MNTLNNHISSIDTIDHVLDFTKLNTSANAKGQKSQTAYLKKKPPSTGNPPLLSAQKQPRTSNISILTEEVIESVYAGHTLQKYTIRQHKMSSASPGQTYEGYKDIQPHKPSVQLIIDVSRRSNWSLNIEPGAWRRIVMNLFSNALKYTEHGYIRVTLDSGSSNTTEGVPLSNIVLGISDSGKGISESYLRHHLFTPFSQEDSLSVGTGLGLSIVRQLVEDLGGFIEFNSEKGSGTQVKVSLPVACPTSGTLPILTGDSKILSEVQTKTEGMIACLIAFNAMPAEATGILSPEAEGIFLLKSSMSKLLADWFGMRVIHSETLDLSMATISCIMESSLNDMSWDGRLETLENACLSSPGYPSKPILLVLCTTISQGCSFITHRGGYHVAYVQQPFGPHKLALALARCFAVAASTELGGSCISGEETYFHRGARSGSRSPNIDVPMNSPHFEPLEPFRVLKLTSLNDGKVRDSHAFTSNQTSESNSTARMPSQVNYNQTSSTHRHNVLLVEDNAINMNVS